MGNEFLQSRKNAINAKWDRRRAELARGDLFTQYPDCATYAGTARIRPGIQLSDGESVTVRLSDRGLIAVRDMTVVADFENAPPEMIGAVQSAGGIVGGVIDVVLESVSLAEITLCP